MRLWNYPFVLLCVACMFLGIDAQVSCPAGDFISMSSVLSSSTVASVSTYSANSVTYTVYTFLSAGTITFPQPALADILIVGGGGGGGAGPGGGGAGGGLLYATGVTVPAGSYTISVGDGGRAGSSGYSAQGGDGGASDGFGATCNGGGGGIHFCGRPGLGNGGSTGTCTKGSILSSAFTSGGGGSACIDSPYVRLAGGAGGGAGGDGSTSGGGIGYAVNIYNGNPLYFGGGGGGGQVFSTYSMPGGLGGAGGGGTETGGFDAGGYGFSDGSAGAGDGGKAGTNTGSGGGGGGENHYGGKGGSGIVIVRVSPSPSCSSCPTGKSLLQSVVPASAACIICIYVVVYKDV